VMLKVVLCCDALCEMEKCSEDLAASGCHRYKRDLVSVSRCKAHACSFVFKPGGSRLSSDVNDGVMTISYDFQRKTRQEKQNGV
jgi:hypothetical protein